MTTRQYETVTASIWAQDTAIGIVCIRQVNGIHTPLDQWKSNLNSFDFGFVAILERWQTEHGLTEAIMNLPRNYQGQSTRHPIKTILPIECKLKPEIEIFEGLACLYYGIQQETIDFSHYNKARFMEQVKRLDTSKDPCVLAFLQAITKPASGGYRPSKSKDSTPVEV